MAHTPSLDITVTFEVSQSKRNRDFAREILKKQGLWKEKESMAQKRFKRNMNGVIRCSPTEGYSKSSPISDRFESG